MTMADELQKLQSLRETGTLTEEEFARAKARILGEGAAEAAATPKAEPAHTGLHSLYRDPANGWIGGVCEGLGAVTNMPAWTWRIFFVMATCLHLLGVLIYLIMWIFVPRRTAMLAK